MRAQLLLLVLPLLALPAAADDCIAIPDVSLCGVPITATPAQFIKALGKPDGTARLGKNGVALFFGPHMAITFRNGKLDEAHGWTRLPEGSLWNKAPKQGKGRLLLLKFAGLNPWGMTRAEFMAAADGSMPVLDADAYGEARDARGKVLMVDYDQAPESGLTEADWRSFKIDRIWIEFNTKAVAP